MNRNKRPEKKRTSQQPLATKLAKLSIEFSANTYLKFTQDPKNVGKANYLMDYVSEFSTKLSYHLFSLFCGYSLKK